MAEFPTQPEPDSQSVASPIGSLLLNTFMCEPAAGDDNLSYGVMLTKYPDSLINTSKPGFTDILFRGAIDGAVKNCGGKLLSEKEIQLNGYSGREVRIDYQDGLAVIKMRMYLVGSTIYIQQVIIKPAKENNKNQQRFFDSFKLE